MARVVIVSSFGRGEYLAERLVAQGLEVDFIDLSHLFTWPTKLWDGPLPLFQSPRLSQDLWNWVEKNFELRESRPGFSILSSLGVLEFRGSVIEHRVKALGLDPQILHTPPRGFESSFAKSWPLRLMAFGTLAQEIHPSQPVTGSDLKKYQESLVQKAFFRSPKIELGSRKTKTRVLKGFQIEDIALSSKRQAEGILIKKERSELVGFDQLVWALSSSETKFLNPVLSEKLFGGEARESVYSWICYEVKMAGVDFFPQQFIWVEDPELPWSHQNFMSFHRLGPDHFRVWEKISSAHRFLSSTLEAEENSWIQAFEKRVPELKIEMLERPIESKHTSKSLGPSIFGTYKEGILQRNIELGGEQIHYLSPECIGSVAPHLLLEFEEKLEAQIGKWWKREQEIIAKKKLRESRP
jgi:hypothetical protein